MLLTDREAGYRKIISGYHSRAKRKNIPFTLTDFQCRVLLASACYYCGIGPTRAYNRHGATTDTEYGDLFLANGIDRIDSRLGYTPENSVTACFVCNRAKSDLDLWSFHQWLGRAYRHLTEKGVTL